MPVAQNQLHPGSFIDLDAADVNPTLAGLVIMAVGTKLASGTANDNEPVRVITKPDAASLLGAAGPLTRMIKRLFTSAPNVEIWALPVPEAGGGVAASDGYFEATGTATAAGEIFAYVGDERYAVAVAIGDGGPEIVDKLDIAIGDATETYVASTIDDGISKLTLTYNFKGASSNQVRLAWNLGASEKGVAGITLTVSQPTNGAVDPTITTALANLGAQRVDYLMTQYNADAYLDELEAFMLARDDSTQQIAGLIGYGQIDTITNIITDLDANRNSEFSSDAASEQVYTPAFEFGALYWGAVSQAANVDRNATMRRIALPGLGVVGSGDDFVEREALLQAGASPIIVDSGLAYILRTVTTRTETNGQPDGSWRQVEKRIVMFSVRDYLNAYFEVNWSKAKLSEAAVADLPPGVKIMTPDLFKGIMATLYINMRNLGWLDPAGLDTFKASLVAEINQPGRIDWSGQFAWLSGFFILSGQATFTSGT